MSAKKEKFWEDIRKVSKITGLKSATVMSAIKDMKIIQIPDCDEPDYIIGLSKEVVKRVYRYLVTERCEKANYMNYRYCESFIWEQINKRIDDIGSGKDELPEGKTVFDAVWEIYVA